MIMIMGRYWRGNGEKSNMGGVVDTQLVALRCSGGWYGHAEGDVKCELSLLNETRWDFPSHGRQDEK